MPFSRAGVVFGIVTVLVAASLGPPVVEAQGPLFFSDDPLLVDDDRALDAGGAQPIPPSQYYDFIENTFLTPGDDQPIRALNTNTIDEVPDSTWFTGRIGRREMSLDELGRGPNTYESMSVDGWPIVEGKGSGQTPGWRVQAPDGVIYQIEFDPLEFPERTSGAEIIGSRAYHAIGFNVAETYLIDVDPEAVIVAPDATIEIEGSERPFTLLDVDDVLDRSARRRNGHYRAVASRFVDGEPLGAFRYYGTRPDDPNDLFPHEHRRELRGNRVFAAWLNHVDSRGINSLDVLDGPVGSQYVKHYMFDFGSIMGGGPGIASEPRAGNEYILDWGKGFKTLASLGLYVRPWLRVNYPDAPSSVGRFEAESFDPESWRPEYPNPAFRNLRLDDAYWGARIVARFSDEAIERMVEEAGYSDPTAAAYIVDTLVERRDKVKTHWLNQLLPVEAFEMTASGEVRFENTAVNLAAATPAGSYVLTWFRVDNSTGEHEQVGSEVWTDDLAARAPAALLSGSEYIGLIVRGIHREHPGWLRSTRVHFRRASGEGETDVQWETVGVQRNFDERIPETRP